MLSIWILLPLLKVVNLIGFVPYWKIAHPTRKTTNSIKNRVLQIIIDAKHLHSLPVTCFDVYQSITIFPVLWTVCWKVSLSSVKVRNVINWKMVRNWINHPSYDSTMELYGGRWGCFLKGLCPNLKASLTSELIWMKLLIPYTWLIDLHIEHYSKFTIFFGANSRSGKKNESFQQFVDRKLPSTLIFSNFHTSVLFDSSPYNLGSLNG